jgi:hypothetical protein
MDEDLERSMAELGTLEVLRGTSGAATMIILGGPGTLP